MQRRTLIDRAILTGKVSFGRGTALVYRGQTGTVTWLPRLGVHLRRGDVVLRVDQKPVVLLSGAVPAFRALALGTVGRDVAQLQRNLSDLRFGPLRADGHFGRGTVLAVRRLQRRTGTLATGRLDLGSVLFSSNRWRVANLATFRGASVANGSTVLTVGPEQRVIEITVPVAQRALARRGAAVDVTLPSQRTVAGQVATIGSSVVAGRGDAGPTVVATARLTNPASTVGLDRAPVSVGLRRAVRRDALTVPVVALEALPGGGFGVRLVSAAGTRVVRVRPGMIVDGVAEISGAVAAGQRVAVPDEA